MKLETGNWLITYLVPQLLREFQNDNDDFLKVLKAPPKKAIGTDGIYFNKLDNNVEVLSNNTLEFTPVPMPGKKGLVEWD